MSKEFCNNISNRLIGNTIAKGRIYVNNGKITKMVYPDEIPDGFKKGRLYKRTVPGIKGRIPWNKGKKCRHLTDEEKNIRRMNSIGKRHYTNGNINIFVYPGTEPAGFYPG